VGDNFSFALRPLGYPSGTLWGWGLNNQNQLGTGVITQSNPSPIGSISGVALAGAGDSHTLALRGDGSLWGWGVNAQGQLGDGGIATRPTPRLASGLTDLVQLAGGIDFSIVLAADGALWSFGANTSGTLGDNTYIAKRSPLKLSLSLVDNTWLDGDLDQDGLTNAAEYRLGTDPLNPDTNGNGVSDSVDAALGRDAASADSDGDGVADLDEKLQGTNPFLADTDGDGVLDGADAFPLDPTRSSATVNPSDHTPPVITLLEPVGATVIP